MTRTIRRFDPTLFSLQKAEPGWKATEDSVLANPRLGIHLVRVVTMDKERIVYDHVLRAERGGGVFVPVDDEGRIGLQAVWRPQTRDQDAFVSSFPDIDFSGLGRVSYEVPRGMGERGETMMHAALREAEEETGGRVTESHCLGAICDNTAFSPHLTEAIWGRIDLPAEPHCVDPKEGIVQGLRFFNRRELGELQREGTLYDGFTLAALAMLWIQHPELFEKG